MYEQVGRIKENYQYPSNPPFPYDHRIPLHPQWYRPGFVFHPGFMSDRRFQPVINDQMMNKHQNPYLNIKQEHQKSVPRQYPMPFEFPSMMGKPIMNDQRLHYNYQGRRLHSEDKEIKNEKLSDFDCRKPLTYKVHTDSALKDYYDKNDSEMGINSGRWTDDEHLTLKYLTNI